MKDVNVLYQNGIDVQTSLELFGDMASYDETLQDFLSTIQEKLNSLNTYKEASDMPNYAILVHSLKSDSKYLGFTALAQLAYDHEMQSKAYQVGYVLTHYEELIREVTRIVSVVSNYLGKDISLHLPNEKKVVEKDKKILVVDDSNIIQNLIYKIFSDEFDVLKAQDGKEAVDILNQDLNHQIIGVLLDLNMPNVDGFQVLEYFKMNNLFTKYPVAIITGDDSKENVSKAYNYPIVDVLSKPFNERDVKRALQAIMNFQ